MIPTPETIDELVIETPQVAELQQKYDQLHHSFSSAENTEQRIRVIEDWDQLRRHLDSWANLVELRFHQNTSNSVYKQDRDYSDSIRPKLLELDAEMKRRILAADDRNALEETFGQLAFLHWESDVTTYNPAIEQDMVKQSELEGRYIELLASAEFEFQGEKQNMSTLAKFNESLDRDTRRAAETARWNWYGENRAELDQVYDQLVHLRHGMAKKLGFDNFVQLGYKLLHRIGYDKTDVEQYRNEVRDHVVPLGQRIRQRQRDNLGLDELKFWDLGLFDKLGNPKPAGDHDWMLTQAQRMFEQMSGEIGDFFRMMTAAKLLDLKSRPGKAGGGFCTDFSSVGWPFIYANFNGTRADVEVFTHEVGHALQCYSSRDKKLIDYLWPTYEACEIHSMSLEFLTWPGMELFFHEDAERFRNTHLTQSLLFLPYGVAIDHFQHLVYEDPDASPQQRHEMWRDLERMYLPWREYEDLKHPSGGGAWQEKRHIYLSPFYYIDYTLALCCALQFWLKAEQDRDAAIESYLGLCHRGGEAPFLELVESAGLVSPFAENCLTGVVQQAETALKL